MRAASVRCLLAFCLLWSLGASTLCAAAEPASAVPQPVSQRDIDAAEKQALAGPGLHIVQIQLAKLSTTSKNVDHIVDGINVEIDKVLKKNPESPYALRLRANLRNAIKDNSGNDDYEKTIRIMNKRIDSDPEYAENYALRGKTYKDLKNYDAAAQDLIKAVYLEDDPDKISEDRRALNEVIKLTQKKGLLDSFRKPNGSP